MDVEPYVDAVEGAMLKFYSWACTLTYEERLQMVRQRESIHLHAARRLSCCCCCLPMHSPTHMLFAIAFDF